MMLRYVLGNCGALVVGLLVAYFALLRGGHITAVTIRTGDFVQYYAISKLILAGHGGAIYDFHRLSHVEAQIVYPLSVQHGVLPFLYPPYFALVVAPLAALPYPVAYTLWLVLNGILLACVLFALERYGGLSERASVVARLVCVCSLPVIMTLALGQVSILILALLTLSFFAIRSGRYGPAGAALAFALIKPPYVLPFLVVLIAQRHWRALAGFAATCLVLILAPMPLLGISIDPVYTRLLVAVTGWQGRAGTVSYHHVKIAGATYDPHLNDSISGFSQLLLPTGAARVFTLGLSLVCLIVVAWYARRETSGRNSWIRLANAHEAAIPSPPAPPPRWGRGDARSDVAPGSPSPSVGEGVGGRGDTRLHLSGTSPGIDLPFALAAVVALLLNPHVLVHDVTILLLPVWVALRYRREGPRRLGVLLTGTYLAVAASGPMSYVIPFQLAVGAMVALGLWLLLTLERPRAGWPPQPIAAAHLDPSNA